MRWRFPVVLWAVIVAACLNPSPSRATGADERLSRGVSDFVFHLTAYDGASRPVNRGQGLLTGPRGAAVVSLASIEGAASAVATMMDGRTLNIKRVRSVDAVAGLAEVRLERGAPAPLEKGSAGKPPGAGERLIFSGSTPSGGQVCVESVTVSVRPVPGLDGMYYLEATSAIPSPGGAVFGSDGRLAGMVTMRFGRGNSGVLASSERVVGLAARRNRSSSLSRWSGGRTRDWAEGPHAGYMEGYAALQRGQPQTALDILEAGVADWPVLKAETWALLGEANLALNLMPEAIMALKASVDCGRTPCWAYQRLAWAYMETGQLQLAEAACREYISMEPESPNGYLLMAHLRNLEGDYKQSVYEARRALKRNPECPCGHFERGRGYIGLGRYEDAVESLMKATTLDPKYGEAFSSLGYAYLKCGKTLQAIVVLREAVDLKPEMSGAWADLGEAYSKAGLHGKAVAALRQAVCLDASRSYAYCRLAREFMREKMFAQAEETLREGLSRCERSQWLIYYLGKAYCQEGRIDLAREQAETLHRENKDLAGQLLRMIDLGTVDQAAPVKG